MKTTDFELGALADPNRPVTLPEVPRQEAAAHVTALEHMIRIRRVEEVVGDLAAAGEVKTPVHLGIGQEGVAAGVSMHLRATDHVFGGHRSHSHYLALGGDVRGLVAEIMCRETGVSAGRGGSMHLIDREVGFEGSVPLVGATVPLAVGAGLAARMEGRGNIAVAWFGDGACEEGGVQEALNLAATLPAPVLFVVENNLYSSHLDIKQRQPHDRTARYADAHGVAARTVDGNDVAAVSQATAELLEAMRATGVPGFLEAVTYRWRGHVGPDPNIDVGLRRSAEEVNAWKRHDPVARLRDALMALGALQNADFETMQARVEAEVQDALAAARAADFPDAGDVATHVYAPIHAKEG